MSKVIGGSTVCHVHSLVEQIIFQHPYYVVGSENSLVNQIGINK